MHEGTQHVDDDVEIVTGQKHQDGGHNAHRSCAPEHLGHRVDDHGDDPGGQSQGKDPGIAQQIAEIAADVVQSQQPSQEPADDAFFSRPPKG